MHDFADYLEIHLPKTNRNLQTCRLNKLVRLGEEAWLPTSLQVLFSDTLPTISLSDLVFPHNFMPLELTYFAVYTDQRAVEIFETEKVEIKNSQFAI